MAGKVAQREAHPDARRAAECGEAPDRQRADVEEPERHSEHAGDEQGRRLLVGKGEASSAYREEDRAQPSRTAGGSGARGTAGQRLGDRHAGDHARRPPRCADRGDQFQQDDGNDDRPRQAEPTDAVVCRSFEQGRERHPEDGADHRARSGGYQADQGAIGEHRVADVLLRGADGGQHAQLTQPALGDGGKPGGGHKGYEQEEEGRRDQGQSATAVCDLGASDSAARGLVEERNAANEAGVDFSKHRHRLRRPCPGGRD